MNIYDKRLKDRSFVSEDASSLILTVYIYERLRFVHEQWTSCPALVIQLFCSFQQDKINFADLHDLVLKLLQP